MDTLTCDPILDSERAIVGIILARPSLKDALLGGLEVDCFDGAWTRAAFQVCTEAHEMGRDLTDELLEVELSRRVVGRRGEVRGFLEDCRQKGLLTLTPHNEHAEALRNRRDSRQLKRAVAELDSAEEMEQAVLDWVARRTSERDGGPVPLGDVMREVAARQHAIAEGKLTVGFTTGLDALDQHVQIRAGDAHAIIARTGIGKSAFLLHLLRANAINPGFPVDGLLFSLEMSRDAVATRYLGLEANINTRFVGSRYAGPAVRADIDRIAAECGDVRIEVDGSADLSVAEVVARAKHWKRRRQIRHGIVAVDFAQLVRRERNRDENSAESFQRVAYGLRGFAQTEGLAVVVTAQTNRVGALAEVPQLEHVEGGGGLGRACAVVLGLHMPEKQQPVDVQTIEVRVLKNRHGQAGNVVTSTVDFSTGRFSS